MENEESMVRGLCIWENILHGIVALNEGKLDLLIGIYIMVIELSGVQFGLKSYA